MLPFLDRSPVRSFRYRPLSKQLFWIFIVNFVVLGYVGLMPANATIIGGLPIVYLGRAATGIYFAYFLALWAITAFDIEKPKPLPKSL